MDIRQATTEDIWHLKELFDIARKFMLQTGNPNQWAPNYPSDEQILHDINSHDCFVCLQENNIVATFVLRGGIDPTYDVIYEGTWTNNNPYATIHRIASNGNVKGIFSKVMEFAKERYSTIRIDTHKDNKVMQKAIMKAGFKYCGIIHCWNGSERLAYQYN